MNDAASLPTLPQQVLQILYVLSEAKLFRSEHLDMLWAAGEQHGTFDEIRANVCQMLECLVQGLARPLRDALCDKLQAVRGRSLADTLRLLELLRKLAAGDLEV